jgi:hypothetical protein
LLGLYSILLIDGIWFVDAVCLGFDPNIRPYVTVPEDITPAQPPICITREQESSQTNLESSKGDKYYPKRWQRRKQRVPRPASPESSVIFSKSAGPWSLRERITKVEAVLPANVIHRDPPPGREISIDEEE